MSSTTRDSICFIDFHSLQANGEKKYRYGHRQPNCYLFTERTVVGRAENGNAEMKV